jgi:uncharacterized protein (TIGR03435 family)
MTGIAGNYDASLEISLAEIIAMARAAGAAIPNAPGPAGGPGGAGAAPEAVPVASEPGAAGSSVTDAVQSMGLKLESRKATVDQLIVDHLEKTPTEN